MFKNFKLDWLAGIATIMSMLACYGTLVIISILGIFGFAIVLNETLWAGAIIAFSVLAVIGFAAGWNRHRQPWPIILGSIGVFILGYAMYVQYDRVTEVAGFIFLSLAAFWDWRLRRQITMLEGARDKSLHSE